MNLILNLSFEFLELDDILKLGNKNILREYVLRTFTLNNYERQCLLDSSDVLPTMLYDRVFQKYKLLKHLREGTILDAHTRVLLSIHLRKGYGYDSLFRSCYPFLRANVYHVSYDGSLFERICGKEPFEIYDYKLCFVNSKFSIFSNDFLVGVDDCKGTKDTLCIFEHPGVEKLINLFGKNECLFRAVDLYKDTFFEYSKSSTHAHRRPKIRRRRIPIVL